MEFGLNTTNSKRYVHKSSNMHKTNETKVVVMPIVYRHLSHRLAREIDGAYSIAPWAHMGLRCLKLFIAASS